MKTTCPACGAVNSLDSIIGHDAARSLIIQAMEQTPVGKRLIRYVGLFRPEKRNLSYGRIYGLLGELLDMIKSGQVERHGRLWAAPETVWILALDGILALRDEGKLTLPLKSHGYLLEIITGQANKAEAAAETRKEGGYRGVTQTGTHASHKDFEKPKKEDKAPRMAPDLARERINRVKQQITKGA